jgi:hypothetical protein
MDNALRRRGRVGRIRNSLINGMKEKDGGGVNNCSFIIAFAYLALLRINEMNYKYLPCVM